MAAGILSNEDDVNTFQVPGRNCCGHLRRVSLFAGARKVFGRYLLVQTTCRVARADPRSNRGAATAPLGAIGSGKVGIRGIVGRNTIVACPVLVSLNFDFEAT
jgi:hypothetical protein